MGEAVAQPGQGNAQSRNRGPLCGAQWGKVLPAATLCDRRPEPSTEALRPPPADWPGSLPPLLPLFAFLLFPGEPLAAQEAKVSQ